MTPNILLQQIHHLSDVELALLLSLTTHEHPILTTPAAHIDTLIRELSLIASQTFRLTHAVIHCTPSTTLDDFTSALLIPSATAFRLQEEKPNNASSSSSSSSSPSPHHPSDRIANCILAPNLNLAPRTVQLQTLELLRTRRIFTHTSVQTAPKRFLFIPILGTDAPGGAFPPLNPHLNDYFALAHWHDPEDGYVNIDAGQEQEEVRQGEEEQQQQDGEASSVSSVVRREDGNSSLSAVFIPDK
ncbi:hypothetical protein E4U54_007703, partial [Claviceps lovelessii]